MTRDSMRVLTRLRRLLILVTLAIPLTAAQLVRGQPPISTARTISRKLSIPEGTDLTLDCPTVSDVDYEWRKDGKTTDFKEQAIQISAANPEDAGSYYCVARNALGAVVVAVYHVSVEYIHEFADSSDRNIVAPSTDALVLTRPGLVASPNVRPTFSWQRNDTEVTVKDNIYITSNGDLVITNSGNSTSGQYRAFAYVDGLGEVASGVYFVKEELRAIQPSFSIVYTPKDTDLVLDDEETEVAFDCVPSLSDGVNIRWFISNKPVTVESNGAALKFRNRRLIIKSGSDFVKGVQSVSVQCRADAAAGRVFDESTATLRVISPPRLNILPSELVEPVGDSVNVRCSLKDGVGAAEVRWWHDGELLQIRDGVLSLQRLKASDFGVYQCEGTNRAGSILNTLWLREGQPKTADISDALWGFEDASVERVTQQERERLAASTPPKFILKPSTKNSSIGEKAEFLCAAEGEPKPQITWIFNKQRIRGESLKYYINSERLRIDAIKTSDAGIYTCIAENVAGKIQASATLRVSGTTLIEHGPTNQSIVIGTNIEIPCEPSKALNSDVEILWSLNDEAISPSGNAALRIVRKPNGAILINQVGPDNIGEYKCTVRSAGMEQVQTAWLRIIERPSMPVAVSAQLVNNTVPAKIRVSWNQGFDGNSPLIRHSIEMRSLGPTNQWGVWEPVVDNVPPESCCSWLVDNLKPSATAEFRVIAFNRFGPGMPSVPTNNVTMPQQPPASAPVGVAASARSSSSIMVHWQQPPSEQWNGDILGYIIRYRLAGYNLQWNEKNITNSHSFTIPIESLITWRTYEIQVAAYNHRGLGVFSKSVDVTTLEGVPSQAPKQVSHQVLSSTSVTINFIAPDQQRIPGVNLGYKVQFWKGAPGRGILFKQIIVDPIGTELSTTVNDLEKWGHYNVSVLCFTGPGDGPRSDPIVVITEEDVPGAVVDLGIDQDQVMSTSAVLQWSQPAEPNGRIISYDLKYWAFNDPEARHPLKLSGTETNVTIDGLSPSTQYGVEIRAQTIKGYGPWSETRFESGVPPEFPGRPTSVSVSNIEARSVLVQFVPGFDGHTSIRQWIVEGRMGDSSVFHTLFNISAPKARSFTMIGLRPYTKYQIRLLAENIVGRGPPSELTNVFETKSTIPENITSRLWAEPVSATALVLSWTPLQHYQWNGQPQAYLVMYRQNGTQQWREIRTTSLRSTDFTLRDLLPYTMYEVDVFAENLIGRSGSTGSTTATTYESVPSGAPIDVRATAERLGQHVVKVEWQPVVPQLRNGQILGYKVRVVPDAQELRQDYEKSIEVAGNDTLKATVDGLRPFTSYHVFVSAHTIVGSGPENAIPSTIKTGTDLPTEPTNVKFSLVSENEVGLIWLPPKNPNGRIIKYFITHVRADQDPEEAVQVPIDASSFKFAATALNPDTQYNFTISAENEEGMGPESRVIVRTTSIQLPVKNPPAPSRDERKAFAAREITVVWPKTDDFKDSAPVRFIHVEYQQANDADWTLYATDIPGTQDKATIKHLRPNRSYRVRIRFHGDFVYSSWSAESEWIKTLGDAPEVAPSQLAAAPFEKDGLLLQWTSLDRDDWNSDVLGVRISYRPYPSNESWQSTEIAPRHEVEERGQTVLRGLKSFRHYIINMRAINADGVSEPSVPVFVYVGYSIPRGNVTGLMAEPQSSTALKLRWDSWQDSEDVITGFKIRYVPLVSVLSPESREEQLMIVENNTAVLNDLLKFTQYQISVSPYNRAGEGGMAVVRETTLQDVPGPVGTLRFSHILLDSVNVSWAAPEQPNGRIVRYIVNYQTSKLQDEFLKNIKQPTQMPFIVATDLEEGATYYFSVRAETSAGAGPEVTGNVTIGPTPGGPPPPEKPKPVPGHTSVTLQWHDGSVHDHGIIGHLVQAKRVANAEAPTTAAPADDRRRPRAAADVDPPAHRMGEWVTLSSMLGAATTYEVGYRELHPSSYYVFRVFARNARGVGLPSAESEQLFVPASLPEEPFFTQLWFIALVAMATLVVIVSVVAFLCVTGSARASDKRRRCSSDSLQLADGNVTTYALKQTDDRVSRAGNTRPGTNTSWISDREPPAYGSVPFGGGGPGRHSAVASMYGQLATDTMPSGADLAASQRLSVLAGRDVRGSAYTIGVAPPMARSDLLSPRSASFAHHNQAESDAFDSFDEDFDDDSERGVDTGHDFAGHYGAADNYGSTWHRGRELTDTLRTSRQRRGPNSLHASGVGNASGTGSDTSWPSQPAPALEKGLSSFV